MDQVTTCDKAQFVASGDLESLKGVLECEVSCIDSPIDSEGTTLLHIAANSTCEVVHYLLDLGADVTCQTDDGLTPLHIAAMWNRREIVQELLSYGAESEVFDCDGMLPADYAREEEYEDCVKLLTCMSNEPLPSGDPHNMSCAQAFVSMALAEDSFITHKPPDSASLANLSMNDELYITAMNSSDTVLQETSHTQENSISRTEQNPKLPQEIIDLTDSQLHERLVSFGEQPGPINEHTRMLYKTYLVKIQSKAWANAMEVTKGKRAYKYELALVLSGISPIPSANVWDDEVVKAFISQPINTPPPSSRQSNNRMRDHFNYLLIDPQGLEVLGDETNSKLAQFKSFIDAIFYIGKGKNSRPIQHLKDAKISIKDGKKMSLKLEKIADIWCSERGVISMPMYHNSRQGEAFSRECCMIDAIGLNNLTNKVSGHMHGPLCQWSLTKRRQFGVYLLYKGYQMMKVAVPAELKEDDL